MKMSLEHVVTSWDVGAADGRHRAVHPWAATSDRTGRERIGHVRCAARQPCRRLAVRCDAPSSVMLARDDAGVGWRAIIALTPAARSPPRGNHRC